MIKFLSLFSGIGAFEKALENLNVPFQLVGYSEIDKYASRSYSAVHGISEDMNLGDVSKIDEWDVLEQIDLLTYGFPCTDISNAGYQKGFYDDEGAFYAYDWKKLGETWAVSSEQAINNVRFRNGMTGVCYEHQEMYHNSSFDFEYKALRG